MKLRILLTGSRGMVGRNFLEHGSVKDFDMLTPTSSELDLLDYSAVASYVSQHKPDIIVHAAGTVGGIQANLREPMRFLLENLDMGRNVVLAARRNKIRKFLNIASSCIYPRNATNPLREDMILKGELEPTNEGYALSKIVTARLCLYISREDPTFLYKTVIPCNLYGRHDKFDPDYSHLIPAIIHKMHIAKKTQNTMVNIWGDGTARREFMYASDLVDCLVEAIYRFEELPYTMNIGINSDYTINEYYTAVSEIVGWQGYFEHDLTKPVGMKQKLLSAEKQYAWGWAAKTNLRDGIAKTYEYYLRSNG